ncbi:MAG: glycosyltransferase family A protein [Phycisphaeraceae bacterium]
MTPISVVIPCYNGMPYLPQALDSALAQTHRPMQIVVVDDGSRDASAATIQRYVLDYPDRRIKLIQQANAGEPAARNAGIRAATAAGAAWIAQLDTDDWWEPRKLEMQLAAAEAAGPDCVLVHTGFVRHHADGPSEPWPMDGAARRTGWCTAALLEPTSIAHPSTMVRSDALSRIGGYDPSFKQACDIDLYFRLSAVGAFAFVAERLLHYRMHPGQMSASQFEQIQYHHRAVRQFFAAHPDIEAKIGPSNVRQALTRHVEMKLESLYWRRRLDDFRNLLEYASEQDLQSATIEAWRRKARWPNWIIRVKDRLGGRAKSEVRSAK